MSRRRYALSAIVSESELSVLGLRDQMERIEEDKRSKRPPEAMERMRERLELRDRTAFALSYLQQHRESVPTWIIALFEQGACGAPRE